ncbi:hypothetical protein [Pimelobacter simplex]|uniref:hypothetical protein n=1 Tax=Nocardioides simplex TaxID=2045 RepID=UPI003AAF2649
MRTALPLLAVALAAALAACGGAPDDASAEDFCAAWTEGSGGSADGLHDRAAALEDAGTPADVSTAARSGYEIFVEQAKPVDDADVAALDQAAATPAGLAEVYGISEDEAADVVAFFDYANTTCPPGD